jgi:molecular chaperone GrpE
VTDKQDAPPSAEQADGERIVIKDKRKINSDGTPKAAPPADPAPAADPVAAAEPAAPAEPEKASPAEAQAVPATPAQADAVESGQFQSALDELTTDLKRVTAEYANYRKRVERDRTVAAEQAVGMVLGALLPVLDDIDRARDHGDLTGPFASVAEQLTTAVTKLGLTAFGVKGDGFDPNVHEAVAHLTSPEVTEPTCVDVMRRGYLLGERLLRPAMVAVADPADPQPAAPSSESATE